VPSPSRLQLLEHAVAGGLSGIPEKSVAAISEQPRGERRESALVWYGDELIVGE
jgi:hypothetical protein